MKDLEDVETSEQFFPYYEYLKAFQDLNHRTVVASFHCLWLGAFSGGV